jgi:hypothetical protein
MSKYDGLNIELSNLYYLGKKTGRNGRTKSHIAIPDNSLIKITADQVSPFNGTFRAWAHKNCNFKLKRNKIRKLKFRKTLAKNKCFLNEKSKIPKAPHNTSQYLIQNYQNENPSEKEKINQEFQSYEDESDDGNYMNDLCIPGGTMKGIIYIDSSLGFNIEDYQTQSDKDKDLLSLYSTEFSTDDSENNFLTTDELFQYEYS